MDATNKFFSEVVANSLVSMAQLSWSVEGDRALARFTLHEITVEVSFEHRSGAEWQVAFGVTRGKGSDIYAASPNLQRCVSGGRGVPGQHPARPAVFQSMF
jgi:hypothetical protein